MALTEEQRKRMEENRKRALEIKRKKQLEKEKNNMMVASSTANNATNVYDAGGFVGKVSSGNMESPNKKRRMNNNDKSGNEKDGCTKSSGKGEAHTNTISCMGDASDDESLEDFEINAAPYISQTEAQRTYCLPKGTLDVCSFIEKDNPHKKGWSKMKLYVRSEVRKRAHKRFGGKAGLIEERNKRKNRRFEKDLAGVKHVFG